MYEHFLTGAAVFVVIKGYVNQRNQGKSQNLGWVFPKFKPMPQWRHGCQPLYCLDKCKFLKRYRLRHSYDGTFELFPVTMALRRALII